MKGHWKFLGGMFVGGIYIPRVIPIIQEEFIADKGSEWIKSDENVQS